MKIITTILIATAFTLSAYSQQSKTGKHKPTNVSNGLEINLTKNQVVISNVPTYIWQHGCGPTALGMLIGYYDMQGYSDLIIGDASTQTSSVNNAIANTEHYNDYSLPEDYYPNLEQDNSELGGAHTSNCIADFMETSYSVKGNYYGWSWSNKIDDAFVNYVQMRNPNYTTTTDYNYFNPSSSWDIYKNEIDNNRPVILLVDTDGNGGTDHFITGIGYDEATSSYAAYDTWDNNIHWFEWRGLATGNNWGIYGFNILHLSGDISVNKINNNQLKFNIFPNPAKNFVDINLENINTTNSKATLCLYNNLGTLVLSKEVLTKNNKLKLDVSEINSGNYFLKVTIDNKTHFVNKISIIK